MVVARFCSASLTITAGCSAATGGRAREDVLNASRALRAGIAARGVPKAVYVDNGSPFVSGQLLRACALLGIRLIHSRPGRPEGRGKIERAFRTVRQQWLVELEDRPPAGLEELNRLFQAWVESVYHRRVHSETGQAPLERFLAAGAPTLPAERTLREAFRWSEWRTVSKTGTVGIHGNSYEVDPELAGRRVELVFDPLVLADVEVRVDGRPAGMRGAAGDQASRAPARPARRASVGSRPGSTTSA